MKKALLSLLLTFLLTFLGNSYETYKQIKIFVPDQASFQKLLQSGIDLEGVEGKIGDWFEFVVDEKEHALLQKLGFVTFTIIDDYSKFIENRLFKGPYNALGFGYGSMGGYYTYNEILQQLDSMKISFPNLITNKQIIGNSIEGRNIYAVKISDNPDLNETDEPAVLFTALTHAREPQGMMTLLYYMWWLLENYSTNNLANYLVNNRQIWFIPVINPDGYVYNQTTNPYGGGMWRKNRRNNGDGSYGVDLNRNFGPYAYWNAPNGGSSTIPSDNTYRGTAPFSEPETQTIQNFLVGKNIRACLNYHTYGNLLIYPYGALVRETPDSLIYRDYAKDMTKYNSYKYGTDQQTVLYSTRGNSDDYMYDGDIPNNGKIFAMTPEVGNGTDGFWPPTARILPLAIENLYPNLYITTATGALPKFFSFNITDSSGDNFIDRGESFTLNVVVRNKGMDSAKNVTFYYQTNNQDLIFSNNNVQIGDIPPFSNSNLNINCKVNKRATTGVFANLYFNVTGSNDLQVLDTISILIGKQMLVFSDSVNDAFLTNWTTNGWGTSTDAVSPPYSLTDSPLGDYINYADNQLTLKNNLNLAFASSITLKFSAKWQIEPRYDFAMVEVSSNGGLTWTSVKGKYTNNASGFGVQSIGTYGYDGMQSNWIEEEIDLSKFASSQFKFRFRLRSDSYGRYDGFYVDNIRLLYSFVDSAKYSDMAYFPQEINFGDVQIFEKLDSSLMIQNLASSNDSLRGNIRLKYGVDFKISSNKTFVIPVGSQKNFQITFRPQSLGILEDTLIVNHSSDVIPNPLLIPLVGNGINNYSYRFLSDLLIIYGSLQDTLTFGAEDGASDGIDSLFNEIELGEIPPEGTFDIRWMLENSNGTKIDIRDTISFDNISNVYKLRYQLENETDTLILKWDKNKFAAGTYVLIDSSTNGMNLFVNMIERDSLMIVGSDYSPLLINHKFIPEIKVKYNKGWNIVSVPAQMENYSKDFIFPGSTQNIYYFDSNNYLIADTLQRGRGYWVKFDFPREYVFFGFPTFIDTLILNPGWNLIGTMSDNISVNSLEYFPPDNIISFIYGFNNGYIIEDTLRPGKGYWVKTRENGKLIFNVNKRNKNNSNKIIFDKEINTLKISVTDNTQNVYFTSIPLDDPELYQMPPLPPNECFDVRFSSNRILESLDGLQKRVVELMVQTNKFPVLVTWDRTISYSVGWKLIISSESGNFEYKLDNPGSAYINNSNERIFLRAEKLSKQIVRPKEYSLEQNYPNPFNSKTKIKYSIPNDSKVTIKLYDLLGREVKVLVDDFHSAGFYEYDFDLENLPSGVYYYRMKADNFVQVKKLLMIK